MAAEPLSVAVITRNEEERLPACLASVAGADEVVVVDAESTDRTREIARDFGARVVVRPWEGFGRQKQFALNQCSHRWVFILDADERLPQETLAEIRQTLDAGPEASGFRFRRKNFFCGRWMKHGGWWPDPVLRLVDRHRARVTDRLVHEALEVDGEVADLAGVIVHETYRDLAHTLEKINRYSSAGAEELFRQGRKVALPMAVARGAWGFWYDYLVRAGFLDGSAGLLQAACNGVNVLFKYAKLWELHRKAERS